MLDWYRALLDLRRRYVVPGERTCHAEWRDGVLTMQLPAHDPRLLVVAAFKSASSVDVGWKLELESDEDGYSVRVYRR